MTAAMADEDTDPNGAVPTGLHVPAQIHGAVAGAELAMLLDKAWSVAGRPTVSALADEVGYADETVAKVLNGRVPPAWHLVRKLGAALGVPHDTVHKHWYALWTAADTYRRAAPYPVTEPAGAECGACGAWVVNDTQHHEWHRWMETQQPEVSGPLQWASLRDSLPRRDKYR